MNTKKDEIDMLSKIVDSLYKKLIILVAISGGFGVYGLKFITHGQFLAGYGFISLFTLVSISIFLTYMNLNDKIKILERIYDE